MVTGTETPEGTILMQARIIRDLRTENASLKTMVEKFTAERSKKLGTANKSSLTCLCFHEWVLATSPVIKDKFYMCTKCHAVIA